MVDQPSRKSVSERLPDGFQIAVATSLDATKISIGGAIATQDQLDAVVTALSLMRDWFLPSPDISAQEQKGVEG